MVKNLLPKKPRAINGGRAPSGHDAGGHGWLSELWATLLVSALAHAGALAALFLLTPYVFSSRLRLPPAQMVQLVDLPGGGGSGGQQQGRETHPSSAPKKPEPAAEPLKTERPPEPKPEKTSPPKHKTPAPEVVPPIHRAKEPPKKTIPKREEKKPTTVERRVAEKKPQESRETHPRAHPTSETTQHAEASGRAEAERSVRRSGTGPGVGPGNGLALGTGGGSLSLDTANFPFTYYLRQVTNRIEENWVRPQENTGRVIVYFRIKRDGSIDEPQIYESSRNQTVDLLADAAIKRAEPFPPLPIEFGGDYLGIYLCFGLGSTCPGQKEG